MAVGSSLSQWYLDMNDHQFVPESVLPVLLLIFPVSSCLSQFSAPLVTIDQLLSQVFFSGDEAVSSQDESLPMPGCSSLDPEPVLQESIHRTM